MSELRRFARFRHDPVAGRPQVFPLPDDGLCLSAFVLVHPTGRPREVLAGRMDPNGPWADAAAVDAPRIASFRDRWVLPASQLLFFEDPAAAARRITAEQLGRTDLDFGTVQVFSEAYPRDNAGSSDPHWDFHFVYRAQWPGGEIARSKGRLWKELRFVEVAATPRDAFARGHGDVLALAGLDPLDGGPA